MGSALAGLDLMPAKLAELLVLVGLAAAITRATDRRRGVRQLFAGLLRWRLGWRYLLLVRRHAAAHRRASRWSPGPCTSRPTAGSPSA